MANLKEHLAIGEEIKAWKQGIEIARRLARSIGMKPAVCAQDDGNDIGENDNDGHQESGQHNEANVGEGDYWFYRPFEC